MFLDASYAISLALESDQHHDLALKLSLEIEAAQTRLVTTRAILLEIGNALSRARFRSAGFELLQALEADAGVEIVSLTDSLYLAGLTLFSSRGDKDWGLTDCISFVVMTEREIKDALTRDVHFQQAGFRALMRE